MKKGNTNDMLKEFYGENKNKLAGEYPFTHGIYKNMYRDRLWTMRQYAGFSTAKESNKRYRYLLKEGVKGLSIAFDLPTQTGYDSDHNLSEGEVGKVGVPISSIEDMKILLDEIPLNEVSISMTINSTAAILLAFIIAIADEKKIGRKLLKGTVQNDILKEYIARGTYIYPPNHSVRIVTDILEFCSKELPNWNSISISGYHIREAGSTAIEELAFTFSNGITYIEEAQKRGLNVDEFCNRISFFFNSHNNFFEEIAKFRAARRIWAKIMKERFKAINKKSQLCRFHTQTAGSTLAAKEIDNNIVRTTLQATAAILGGTQSLHTNSRDEALALPNEDSAKLALRTQQIIAYESGIPNVVDPLAGSNYIEELTDIIERETFSLINEIDGLGGAITCIEKQFQQNKIVNSAYEFQKSFDAKKSIQVGVNKFSGDDNAQINLQKISSKLIEDQINRLERVRKERDNTLVTKKLQDLKITAKSDENLMPLIIEGVKARATLGEISDTLRHVFGEHQE